MKKFWVIIFIVILVGIIGFSMAGCTSTPATVTTTVTPPSVTITTTVTATPTSAASQATIDQLKQLAGPPPSSLDQYFPPKSLAPAYLLEMFTLAGPFEGIGVDLQEQDMANLKPNFQAFQAEYTKVSRMVPEWTSRFPADPVTKLGQAIDSGNPAQIGPVMGGVGQVCADCHLIYQVKVEQKYHWKNFDDVKVTNPVTKQSQAFADYMTTMAGGFEGAILDLQEKQLDNARKNFQDFITEFKALATDGCKQCHTDPVTNQEIPRKYYVDADSMALVNQMNQALAAATPDANAIGNLAGAIGNSICLNCHLVHLPAQTARDQWTQFSNILK